MMLIDHLRQETGGTVYGKDIKSALNPISREKVKEILSNLLDIATCVD